MRGLASARDVALTDLAYGNDSKLRTGVTALGLAYVAAVQSNILVSAPKQSRNRSRPETRPRPAGARVAHHLAALEDFVA